MNIKNHPAKICLLSITFLTLFSNGADTPIFLGPQEVEPPEVRLPYNQIEFDDLISKAEQGDPKSQYILGLKYLYGSTPTGKKDSNEAEKWLLKARSKDYLPAYSRLFNVAMDKQDYQKMAEYAIAAGQRGLWTQYYNAGLAYKNQKKYTKAREYFEKNIEKLEGYQQDPFYKLVRNRALIEFASLLYKGLGGAKDVKKAMDIFTQLSEANYIPAMYYLAVAYLYGNEVIEKNPMKALILLSKIEKMGEPKVIFEKMSYLQSQNLRGLMHEKGFGSIKNPNYSKAYEYYKKAYQTQGKFHVARLILTGKVPGDREQAKKILEEAGSGNTPNRLAAYLYGTILIAEEDPEKGIRFLERVAAQREETVPLVYLQLAIAYHYGFGVQQDEEEAKKYLKMIQDVPDSRNRSLLLARGYMRLIGLGVKQDIKQGLKLIDESENKIDDVFFDTEDIFPVITKLKHAEREASAAQLIAQREASAAQLIAQDEKEKAQKEKKKAVASQKQQKKQSATIHAKTAEQKTSEEEQVENPFKFSAKEWNGFFAVDDGSSVSNIDPEKLSFTIQDPKREEELIVRAKKMPGSSVMQVRPLEFHSRILERQGYGTKKLNHTTTYNHSFAEMLDYVIQYLGELVPFTKVGSGQKEDQLVAEVIRKDLKTGEETKNQAEYTFGEKDGDAYVYHRLLRPVKQLYKG